MDNVVYKFSMNQTLGRFEGDGFISAAKYCSLMKD